MDATTETATIVRGCCPLDCQDSCSWEAEVVDGRAVRVRGAPDHPFTRGALCAKVNDYPAHVYAEDRVLHPLRRVGAKGEGRFERIGWDEAIDTIATRFAGIIEQHGAEALLPHFFLGSLGTVQRMALQRLFHALGASRIHGSICGQSGNALAADGHPIGFDPEEIAQSDLVLLWGSNLLTTSHHHWHFVNRARTESGARIVSIDPRRTRTARASDEHVAIVPGSDAALAAGMAHVLVEEGLADLDYAASVARDLDAYLEGIRAWTPRRAAAVCGIEADRIERLAMEFGRARAAVNRSGIGPQQTRHGEAYLRNVAALSILAGHWKHPGGGLMIESYPQFHDKAAARPDLAPDGVRSLDIARLGEILGDRELDPPIHGLMVWCANPAVHQIDAGHVWDGLGRDDLFTVVVEHFLTDTARFADIVLPSTTQLEHFDIQGAWGHTYISVNRPAIAPLGEALSHGEILRRLARRMGLDHPALHESDEAIAASALPEGVTLDAFDERNWRKAAPPRPDLRGKALPIAGPVPEPDAAPEGGLRLLTPKSHYFMNSTFVNMPRQRSAEGEPWVDLHPDDARHRHVGDGQRVRVRSDRGSLEATARISDGILRGVAAMPGRWWGEADGTDAVGNLLFGPSWSPGGQAAHNDFYVSVEPVEAAPAGQAAD